MMTDGAMHVDRFCNLCESNQNEQRIWISLPNLTCPPKTGPIVMLDLDEGLDTEVAKRSGFGAVARDKSGKLQGLGIL